MSIIDNITKKRKEKGISQKELASLIGVSESAISKWKSGDNEPSMKNLKKIADVLNCSMSELTEGIMPLTGFESEVDITGAANDAPDDKPKPTVEELVMKAFEDNDMRVLFDKDHGVTPQQLIQALKLIEEIKGGRR